jgi:hypothetical protein
VLGPVTLAQVQWGRVTFSEAGAEQPPVARKAHLNALARLPTSHVRGIDWVVVGGESGTNARPMHPDWARSLRDQCAAASVPFFFKQWGAWAPSKMWLPHVRKPQCAIRADGSAMPDNEWHDDGQRFLLCGKDKAGRNLDGVEHNAYPEPRP